MGIAFAYLGFVGARSNDDDVSQGGLVVGVDVARVVGAVGLDAVVCAIGCRDFLDCIDEGYDAGFVVERGRFEAVAVVLRGHIMVAEYLTCVMQDNVAVVNAVMVYIDGCVHLTRTRLFLFLFSSSGFGFGLLWIGKVAISWDGDQVCDLVGLDDGRFDLFHDAVLNLESGAVESLAL